MAGWHHRRRRLWHRLNGLQVRNSSAIGNGGATTAAPHRRRLFSRHRLRRWGLGCPVAALLGSWAWEAATRHSRTFWPVSGRRPSRRPSHGSSSPSSSSVSACSAGSSAGIAGVNGHRAISQMTSTTRRGSFCGPATCRSRMLFLLRLRRSGEARRLEGNSSRAPARQRGRAPWARVAGGLGLMGRRGLPRGAQPPRLQMPGMTSWERCRPSSQKNALCSQRVAPSFRRLAKWPRMSPRQGSSVSCAGRRWLHTLGSKGRVKFTMLAGVP
mmetsp:Transcript_67872/g.145304  ORF Transcript_67872/g.145304 Transcript_67872/m.145304 type:complete len:270 (+) Transcript_67872:88-897(+)